MNGWLPDAGFLLELRKPSPDPSVSAWSDAQPRDSFFLSTATVAAIRRFTELRCDAPLRTEVGIWLDGALMPWFAGRILPLTDDIVLESLRIRDGRQAAEGGAGQVDPLLAATARAHGLTVCTRDASDYRALGASAIDPWEAARQAG